MTRPKVEAAGGVVWRGDPVSPQVALVHRPRYGDWSLPKGKLDHGEHPLLAALREIEEETGFVVRPGRRLASLRYDVAEGPKRVRFWACHAVDGRFRANREVDRLWWGPVAQALPRLGHDRAVLEQFATDTRRTKALVLVRHASAGSTRAWPGPDADRPLDPAGHARTATVTALLAAYDIRRLGTAEARRCQDTLLPYALRTGLPLPSLQATTAGVFEAAVDDGVQEVAALVPGPGGAAWCGQQEVLPELVAGLTARLAGPDGPLGGDLLVAAPDVPRLAKGGLLVLHLDDRKHLAAWERLPG